MQLLRKFVDELYQSTCPLRIADRLKQRFGRQKLGESCGQRRSFGRRTLSTSHGLLSPSGALLGRRLFDLLAVGRNLCRACSNATFLECRNDFSVASLGIRLDISTNLRGLTLLLRHNHPLRVVSRGRGMAYNL